MPGYLPRGILDIDKMRSVLNEDLPKTEGPEAIQVSEVVVAFWGLRQACHFEGQNNTMLAMVHDIISPTR